MSDPKAAWLPDWQSMQKQFFSAWTDAARGGAAPSMPVHEGFDVWLKLFNGRGSGNEVLDRVVGSAKQFADFMQGVIGQLATTTRSPMDPCAKAAERSPGTTEPTTLVASPMPVTPRKCRRVTEPFL